jgi:hypothetical protein
MTTYAYIVQEVLEFMKEDFANKYKMMKREADKKLIDGAKYRYNVAQ